MIIDRLAHAMTICLGEFPQATPTKLSNLLEG
jgi:hypothetical protein